MTTATKPTFSTATIATMVGLVIFGIGIVFSAGSIVTEVTTIRETQLAVLHRLDLLETRVGSLERADVESGIVRADLARRLAKVEDIESAEPLHEHPGSKVPQ